MKNCGEALSGDVAAAAELCKKIITSIGDEGLLLSLVYNAGETGLNFLRKWPRRHMQFEQKIRCEV